MILFIQKILGILLRMDVDVLFKKRRQKSQSDRTLVDLDGIMVVSGNDSSDDEFIVVVDVCFIQGFFHIVFN